MLRFGLALVLVSFPALAQDRLVLADGRELEGRFEGVDGETIRFVSGAGAPASYPFDQVSEVAAQPTESLAGLLETARSHAAAGRRDVAIGLLRTIVEEGRDHAYLAAIELLVLLADGGDSAGAWAVAGRIPEAFRSPAARERFERLRSEILARRDAAVRAVRSAADRGDFESAIRQLERLVAEAEDPLARAAFLVDLDRLYWEWGASTPRSGRGPEAYVCADCGGGLLVDCERCEGKGTVQVTIRAQLDPSTGRMTPARTQDVECPDCKGKLRVLCEECKSTGLAVDALPSAVRSSVTKLAMTLGGSSGPVKKADQVGDALDRLATESRKVDVPADLAVAYRAGKPLRDALGASPFVRPTGQAATDLQKAWTDAAEVDRLGFLLGLGYEFALARATWEAIGPQEAFPDAARSTPRGPMPVLEASAAMKAHAGEWVRATGVWTGTADRAGCPFAREIDLEGDVALTILYYPPAGLDWLKAVAAAEVVRSPGLAQLQGSYPKDLDAKIRGMPPGDRVELLGRIRYYPGRSPIGVFEVWEARSLGKPDAAVEPPPRPEPPIPEPDPRPGPDPRPEPEPEPPVPEPPRPEPARRDPHVSPELAGRSAGALAEEGRTHLARAQQAFVESGSTEEVRRDLERARELFEAAFAADPENQYLDDVLHDLDEFESRLGGG